MNTMTKKTSKPRAAVLAAGALAIAMLLMSCGNGGGYGGGGGGIYYGLLLPPTAFSLMTPANGATGVSVTPTLTWGASTYATGYYVYVKKDSDVAYPAPATVTMTNYTITTALAASTLYDWRVTAFNNNGMATAATFTFTTGP